MKGRSEKIVFRGTVKELKTDRIAWYLRKEQHLLICVFACYQAWLYSWSYLSSLNFFFLTSRHLLFNWCKSLLHVEIIFFHLVVRTFWSFFLYPRNLLLFFLFIFLSLFDFLKKLYIFFYLLLLPFFAFFNDILYHFIFFFISLKFLGWFFCKVTFFLLFLLLTLLLQFVVGHLVECILLGAFYFFNHFMNRFLIFLE